MTALTIRQAVTGDVDRVTELYLAMQIELNENRGGEAPVDFAAARRARELLAGAAVSEDALLLVAVDPAGEVVGYGLAGAAGGTARLVSLYLSPGHRGGPTARLMLTDGISWARRRGCTRLSAATLAKNPMQVLLQRAGLRTQYLEMGMVL